MPRRTRQDIEADRTQTALSTAPDSLLLTARLGPVTLLTLPDRYATGQRGTRLLTTAVHDHGGAWLQYGTPGRLHRTPLVNAPDPHRRDAYDALTRTTEAFFAAPTPDPPRLSLHARTLGHPGGATVRFTHQGVNGTITVHHDPPVPSVHASAWRTFGEAHVTAALHAVRALLSEDLTGRYLRGVRTVQDHLRRAGP